jgi:hypothetical protein
VIANLLALGSPPDPLQRPEEGRLIELRVFEIHEGQCGVLVFVADHLASAFVVPHPEDYRLLHRTLIEDFYGELIFQSSHLHQDEHPHRAGECRPLLPDPPAARALAT